MTLYNVTVNHNHNGNYLTHTQVYEYTAPGLKTSVIETHGDHVYVADYGRHKLLRFRKVSFFSSPVFEVRSMTSIITMTILTIT